MSRHAPVRRSLFARRLALPFVCVLAIVAAAFWTPIRVGALGPFQIVATGGSGDIGAEGTLAAGKDTVAVFVADVNGDRIPDVVACNLQGDTISVYIGQGDGDFNAKVDYPTAVGPLSAAIGDVNNDTLPDI